MIAINLDDPAAARALFDDRGFAMTLVADNGEVSQRYGVTTIPHTVLIDRDGTVRAVSRGNGLASIETAIKQAEQIRK